MSSGGDINFSGSKNSVQNSGGSQSVIGKNEGGMNMGDVAAAAPQEASVKVFIDALVKALPEDQNSQTQEAYAAVSQIEVIASDAELSADSETWKSWVAKRVEKLTPFAPQIGKVLLAFGEGYFTKLASNNAIVAGVLEAFKAARQD